MAEKELILEQQEGVATLSFNRPAARNAMNPSMRDALLEALRSLQDDTAVKVLVLRGKGGSFVAGGDLQAFAATLELDRPARQSNFEARVNTSSELVERLVNFPKPTIAVIEGAAAGAGISIAQCCDFVIANNSAQLSFAHAHVGLALDLGLSYFLPRAAGVLAAKRLAMLGGRVSGREAHELGLVTTVVDDQLIEQELSKVLSSLLKMPTEALVAIKQEFHASATNTLSQQLAYEAEMVGKCAATEEFENRITALVRPKK